MACVSTVFLARSIASPTSKLLLLVAYTKLDIDLWRRNRNESGDPCKTVPRTPHSD